MSEHSNAETPQQQLTRDDFVRQLRQKAENAAEASVHHAGMSQQYLELSQKFAQLAEQAGTSSVAELQQTLSAIESAGTSAAVTAAAPAIATEIVADSVKPPTNVEGVGDAASSPKSESGESSVAAEFPTANSSPQTVDGFPQPDQGMETGKDVGTAATDDEKSPRKSKNKKFETRRLVHRVRSAKLAGKRVRVRAKKSDLKPKLRTTTEELKKEGSSLATSAVLFGAAVFLLSMIRLQFEVDVPLAPIMAGFAEEVQPVEEPMPVEPPEEEQGEQLEQETEEPVEEPVEPEPEPEPEMEEEPTPEPEPEPVETEMAEAPLPEADTGAEPAADTMADVSDAAAVDSRSDAGRQAMLQKYGGSVASESAVQRGLEWLISVQHPQLGYWDFPNVGESGNAGTINNPIGGTAYALLPFLAAGQTHQSGKYQKHVQAGINYLTKVGINVPAGYDLRGMINKQSDDDAPNEAYYVHGAATLALCEAFSMTKDRRLKRAAEGAVKFIVNSQDPNGGGWRYNPQEPGSTSVTAIQLMALMAAKKGGIDVPDRTLQGVMHYLDTVQVDKEGRYGYEVQKKQYKGSITAMALLCRMYLGWGRDDGDMRAGIALLDKAGPYDNLYTLYFATQTMKNWGGEEWDRWNIRLRDDLVSWQETEGPAAGSWKPRTGAIHAKQGGRLLSTALATLTLEVYYRYKPLLPEVTAGQVAAEAD